MLSVEHTPQERSAVKKHQLQRLIKSGARLGLLEYTRDFWPFSLLEFVIWPRFWKVLQVSVFLRQLSDRRMQFSGLLSIVLCIRWRQ